MRNLSRVLPAALLVSGAAGEARAVEPIAIGF
jgi:hypothetical protein